MIVKVFVSFIKDIFYRKKIKMLKEENMEDNKNDKKMFIESLKIDNKKKKIKIKVLTCEGDGLGIKKKITY